MANTLCTRGAAQEGRGWNLACNVCAKRGGHCAKRAALSKRRHNLKLHGIANNLAAAALPAPAAAPTNLLHARPDPGWLAGRVAGIGAHRHRHALAGIDADGTQRLGGIDGQAIQSHDHHAVAIDPAWQGVGSRLLQLLKRMARLHPAHAKQMCRNALLIEVG